MVAFMVRVLFLVKSSPALPWCVHREGERENGRMLIFGELV